jgi:hypothetical protein
MLTRYKIILRPKGGDERQLARRKCARSIRPVLRVQCFALEVSGYRREPGS